MKIHIDFINYIEQFTKSLFPNKYSYSTRNQKYDLTTIIKELLYLLKTGVSYRSYRGPINKSSLYYHFKFFRDNDIFKNVYKKILDEYFKYNKYNKLKYQLVDSSFIYNLNGIEKIGRNKYFKNKKCTKLSCITDINGIPISIFIDSGNVYDAQFIENHLNDMLVITNSKKYQRVNKYKQYMLADKGYDTKDTRKQLIDNGYMPIIDYNRRNTKDPNKIKQFFIINNKKLLRKSIFSLEIILLPKHMTKKEKVIYNKRIKIEHLFCLLKKNKRILCRDDKTLKSFRCFVYLAVIKLLFTKL